MTNTYPYKLYKSLVEGNSIRIFSPFQLLLLSAFAFPTVAFVFVLFDYIRQKQKDWFTAAFGPLLVIGSAVVIDIVYIKSINVPSYVYSFLLVLSYYFYQQRLRKSSPFVQYYPWWVALILGVVITGATVVFLSFFLFFLLDF